MIEISEKIQSEIFSQAEKKYPDECCGLILGTIENNNKYASQIYISENDSAESEQYHRFVITPETMMKAQKYAALNGLDIIGFYHSHPDCAAIPSEYDTSHALPVYSYLITSVFEGKVSELRSWELDSSEDYHKFKSEILKISKGE